MLRRLSRAFSTTPATMPELEIVVLGSGPSSSVPVVRCLVTNPACPVCPEALANPVSKNRRNNPSLLVRLLGQTVLIDCGKTFRDSLLRAHPQHSPFAIDAVVLTHGHADACFGLDDLRDVQQIDAETKALKPLGIHCHQRTKDEVEAKFSYLFQSQHTGGRWTAQLQWQLFEDFETFEVGRGVRIQALPLWHGKDYVASGFIFGAEVGKRIAYLSDLSAISDDAMAVLQAAPIDVLFIDALHPEQFHGTHMNLIQALETIAVLRPKQSYLTGMSHQFNYHSPPPMLAEFVAAKQLGVEMAYDGLRLAW
ncbi:hypothetical protein SPRG_00249 [Saprolegnia parasitica CBS 223.65]|uniref:Metallo-beta-lactamase domain-containing protein n=1 Tax=Saprolegnia parasitica (strain CBS 223.65) TaxID=695850 RepID=A0A067CXF9_SAPPC|nr:hypothetical protein SPRG_00249 [Saprolegnia parasitica CBS 223.65]KDO35399.1 hypothetical protein SPRG_00249 [Saprolegnia parasitica CBS 223.65]|eukprot:XP_012193742.1 hypothetical protein SPRG_00249 [Saprolegnia parasitica CBS 223.65]